jgi:hypothetical protein
MQRSAKSLFGIHRYVNALRHDTSIGGGGYGVRLLSYVNLEAGAVGLIDGMDGATAAIVCTGDSLSRDRTW